MREREAEHAWHTTEMDRATQEFDRKVDQLIAETEARVKTMVTSDDIITGKLRLKVEEAQRENQALHAQQAEHEDRTNALVMKQLQLLNRKIDETLDAGWKAWSAQAAELQVLRADAENRQKEGKGFLKMDKNNIALVREDLEEDFCALIDGHTRAITGLLEEFNDDQMVLRLDAEKALEITTAAEHTVPAGPSLPAPHHTPQDEGSSAAPTPDINTENTEGILHILTKD